MTIQLSDCCKATIDLDKTKERPECYTCSKCGRIIGSPIPERTVEEIVEDFTQYCNDGYNGGKDGLRCTECDRKYRGQAQIEQLCPVCNVRKAIQTIIDRYQSELNQHTV